MRCCRSRTRGSPTRSRRLSREAQRSTRRAARTCLSLSPSSRTSSMIVSRGGRPPSRALPWSSRSRGSNATLLPPSSAEPACVAVRGDDGGSELSSCVEEVADVDEAPTRRRWSTPELMVVLASDERERSGEQAGAGHVRYTVTATTHHRKNILGTGLHDRYEDLNHRRPCAC